MAEPPGDTIMEEREELMVSPTGGQPTRRTAHFLKPSVTSTNGPVFNLPSHSLSSVTSNSQPKKSPLKVSFNGWRNPPKTWPKWVDHMHSVHQSLWKKVGIHDSIMNSTYSIQRDHDLVYKIAEKWCPETKTFVFPFGESTITLEDMIVLGGYSVLGDSVLSPLKSREFEEIIEKLNESRLELRRTKAHKASQNAWINKFMGSGSEIEHEAFLVLWLSRFVFQAPPCDTIGKHVFSIAVLLARGTKIALAPAVLGSLYRDLNLLKERIVDSNKLGISECNDNVGNASALTVWAPFHLVQIWIWERFPTLSPKPKSIRDSEPRLARWDMVKKLNIEGVEVGIDSDRECFQWRPYAMAVNHRLFYKFYSEKEEWVRIDSGLDEDLESFARCLRVCELVGLDCIEQYFPHRVAMQFGMDQDLPGNVARYNATPEIAWDNYIRPITDEKLYIPSRLFESDVTTRYLDWWKKSVVKGVVKKGSRESKKDIGSKKIQKSLYRKMTDCDPADYDPAGFPPHCIGKMSDKDPATPLAPPGFSPIYVVIESSDSDDEDALTLTQLLKNKISSDDKPLKQNSRSSTSDNGSLQSVESMMNMGKNVVSNKPVVERSETVVEGENGSRAETPLDNLVCNNSKHGEGTTHSGEEIPGLELEGRIIKLEKTLSKLKAERFGDRFESKFNKGP